MGPSGGQPARTRQVTISSLFLGSRDRLRELAEAPVESPLGKPPFDHSLAFQAYPTFARGQGLMGSVPRTLR
jgi:PHP family Zn ribbon phosphoesterase